jgi:hypothetical protein
VQGIPLNLQDCVNLHQELKNALSNQSTKYPTMTTATASLIPIKLWKTSDLDFVEASAKNQASRYLQKNGQIWTESDEKRFDEKMPIVLTILIIVNIVFAIALPISVLLLKKEWRRNRQRDVESDGGSVKTEWVSLRSIPAQEERERKRENEYNRLVTRV